mgnify:FL=1
MGHYRRYRHRKNRAKRYKNIIDNCLVNSNMLDKSSLLKCIYLNIGKGSKFNLKLPQTWWLSFIDLLTFADKKSGDIGLYANTLYKETIKLDLSKKNTFELFELYALLIEYGLYRVGLIFRIECCSMLAKCILNNKKNNLLKTRQLLSASFEMEDLDMVGKTLNTMGPKFKDKSDLPFLYIFVKKIHPSFKVNNTLYDVGRALDSNFYSLINGKSVAIVGPIENNNFDEINNFDIIVRFNYKGSEGYLNRTDISYYNGQNGDYIVDNMGGNIPKDLKAAVFKTPIVNNVNGNLCIRKMHSIADYFMLDNSANMLPNTVADLLPYNPSKIKVFSCNMNISFGHGYNLSYGQIPVNIREKFYPTIGHDPFSQYKFMEFLYKNSLIYGSEEFAHVMTLGVDQYMESLQNQYCSQLFSIEPSTNKETC